MAVTRDCRHVEQQSVCPNTGIECRDRRGRSREGKRVTNGTIFTGQAVRLAQCSRFDDDIQSSRGQRSARLRVRHSERCETSLGQTRSETIVQSLSHARFPLESASDRFRRIGGTNSRHKGP